MKNNKAIGIPKTPGTDRGARIEENSFQIVLRIEEKIIFL